MTIPTILILVIVLGGLYALGLVGYRVLLSVRSLKTEQSVLESKLANFEPLERPVEAATPSSSLPISQVLAKREQLVRARSAKAEERRRKLIERLQTIDLDKR
jgi:hypothetical protein